MIIRNEGLIPSFYSGTWTVQTCIHLIDSVQSLTKDPDLHLLTFARAVLVKGVDSAQSPTKRLSYLYLVGHKLD
jgi:hypothetical protein